MRGRGRHNLYSSSSGYSKNNNSSAIVFSSLLFVVGFIIYQLLAAHTNGNASMAERGGAFLKGRLRDDKTRPQHLESPNGIEDLEGDLLATKKEVKLTEEIHKNPDRDNLGSSTSEDEASEVIEHKEYHFDTSHMMFHSYHKGKSGKVVEEMLMAHAYIFEQNATYGGCCGSKTVKMASHEELLTAIGLEDVIRFKCPRDFDKDGQIRRSVIPRERYTSEDIRVWTPEYVDYLRSKLKYPPKQHKEYTIVVHMLRGDVSPCKPKREGFYRYLPNTHYQTLIDKHMKPGARVVIYTSPKSFEDLEEFRRKGYEVNVDADLKDTWKDFATADVFIMSRSDTSIVPAMVAKGKVLYTPFWHHSLRRWKRVNNEVMHQTDEEIERLRRERCDIVE
jgi:hypothetical protein